MKLGILGTGMIVKDVLKTFNEFEFERIAILGTESTRLETEALAKQYQLDQIYYDYDLMLASDLDTIYVALPNHLHFDFALKALQNNKHVIIEKPITANVKELEELILVANKNNLMIFEAMNIHYLPAFNELKKNIKQVGEIKVVTFNYSQYSSRYDAFKEGNILPAFDYHKAGGALMDINVYNLNAIIGLFGSPQDYHYYANVAKGIDTSGVLLMDYENFKAVSIGAKDCKAPILSTIQGDKGVLLIHKPVNNMTSFEYINNQGETQLFEYDEGKHRLYYEFKEFMRMINSLDYSSQEKLLQQSLDIAKVMEQARKQAGVVFDND